MQKLRKVNPNLLFLRKWFDTTTRVFKLQGGTRSGKTFSVLMYFIELCFLYPNAGMTFAVVRRTFPALRATAYRDFIEILIKEGLYNEANHNKSEHIYNLNGNQIEFFSLDEPLKVRGRKRHILFINEANELGIEAWRQLIFRTSHKIIVDYNPHDPVHWLYNLDARKDCKKIITTYKDNPHLTPGQIKEIEDLKELDPDYWNVFGLGQIGAGLRGQIFPNWKECEEMPNKYPKLYGLDFGFTNDPTVLVEIEMHNNDVWVDELIYSKGLTNEAIAEKVLKEFKIKQLIKADSAEAKSIAELQQLGLNISAASKGSGSVAAGIDLLKGKNVHYTTRSVNIAKEKLHYKWKLDKEGNPTNVPVDHYNHAMDAIRYSLENKPVKARFRAAVY